MRWGSLSSQLRGFQMLLANGSILEMNDPAENLHLWRAASVSVGRLGVLTRLTMRIVPQQAIRRSLAEMDFGKFAEQVKAVGREYAAAKAAGDADGQKRALSQLDETQAFWHVPTGDIWRTDYEHLDKEPLSVLLNTGGSAAPAVQAMSGPDGAFDQGVHKALAQNGMMTRIWCARLLPESNQIQNTPSPRINQPTNHAPLATRLDPQGQLLPDLDARLRDAGHVRDAQGVPLQHARRPAHVGQPRGRPHPLGREELALPEGGRDHDDALLGAAALGEGGVG